MYNNRRRARSTLLLVEDNPGDIRLMKELLIQLPDEHDLVCMDNGQSAMNYLCQAVSVETLTLPDVILLDWHLPRLNGLGVLERIKSDPEFRRIPVIVVSSSCLPEEVDVMYEHHAMCFVTKPIQAYPFLDILGGILTLQKGTSRISLEEQRL